MKILLIILTDILLIAAIALLAISAGGSFIGDILEKDLEFSKISILFSVNLCLLAFMLQVMITSSHKKITKAVLVFLSSFALIIYIFGIYQKGLGWLLKPIYRLLEIQEIPSLPGILMLLFICLMIALSIVINTEK